MTKVEAMKRIASITGALTLTIVAAATAQESLGSAGPAPVLRPGWVFTPSLGVSETYDDNITLFSNLEPLNNNDFVSSIVRTAASPITAATPTSRPATAPAS